MATNPPITIGPFANVPAPGSGVKSDWAQQISQYVTDHVGELLYSPITANVSVTATTAATAQTLINPGNITYDGKPVIIQFNTPGMTPPNVTNGQVTVNLWDANIDMGFLAMVYVTTTATGIQIPVHQERRIIPTAGVHNYNLRAWVAPSGTGVVVAGPSTGAYGPTFLRIIRA